MSLDTIIFDWSGVISDDIPPVYNSCMEVFKRYDLSPITLEQFKVMSTNPHSIFWNRILPHVNIKDIRNIFREVYEQQNPPKLIDGVKETIAFLSKQGISLYVLSSHPEIFLHAEARNYGIDSHFTNLFGDKLDKSEFLAGMLASGMIKKESTLFVEDMTQGIYAGKQNGIRTAAVLTGYHNEEKLRQANPDYIFKDITGIKSLFA